MDEPPILQYLRSLPHDKPLSFFPNPGNAGELSGAGAGGYGPNRVCGAVGYTYNIGKYEVTAGQYAAFLNAVAVDIWKADKAAPAARIVPAVGRH